MSAEYKILFLGDIVGRPGRNAVRDKLPTLMNQHNPLFVIVNGENSAGGVGITQEICEELFKLRVDGITLGNHAYNKREVYNYLNTDKPVIRPGNVPAGSPGRGMMILEKEGVKLAVINLCGRVFLDGYDDPFRELEELLKTLDTPHIFLDFHAEATSEKVAMGWNLAGRGTAVVGTHTHVQTADEQILPGGTAYITDVGMCGPWPSVLGMDKDTILHRFRTSMPTRFEVANEPGVISGVVINVEKNTGRALDIQRIRIG